MVNGPVRTEPGFNSTGGVFGSGFRPNATVARAIGLIVRNAFGIRPHVLEQATQGLPGRWQIRLAENEEESPWEPLSVETRLGEKVSAVSATLLRTCEYVGNRHAQDPEQVLADIADTMARIGALIFREMSRGVVLCPEHARIPAKEGFSKADVKSCEELQRFMSAPVRVPVIVAGARNAAMSMVVRVFGEWSGKSVPVGGTA